MISRPLLRRTRYVFPHTTIRSCLASSTTGPSPNTPSGSQHPRAQLEESTRSESTNSQDSQASGSASRSNDLQQDDQPANAILVRELDLAVPRITPFHTYRFFVALEKTFPTPIARTLMKSTRSLLVDRLLKIRREALDVKDMDNQAYLFRAALSELRTEATMRTKNQAAAITTAISSLRRDVDRLDVKMKEDISELKHEIQMEMDSHRNEIRADLKKSDLRMEDVIHQTTVTIGDIRTEIEQAKWDNTRRGVAIFASFVLLVIVLMELQPARKQSYPPKEAVEASQDIEVSTLPSTT
ncbi:hypothetical protein CPB86DRAFT_735198 [Serendipita vermifera]|nr:hypothetical protein CPB86DRAFT_735198 [Serendipita vermifera]